jgi:5S rRNA maturation endonuclease (ribonuclease M5)
MSENSLLEEIYSVLKSKYIDYKDDEQNKNLILKDCPFCQDNNYHFYLGVTVDNLGLWNCFKCSGGHEGGAKNWYRLKKALLGDELIIHSPFQPQPKKAINEKTKFILEWNTALYSDVDTLEWLYKERNIHPDLVNTYKLGVTTITSPNTKKQVKALTIPYFFKNNLVNVKFRVLPPEPKEFIRLPHAQSILYNYDHIDLTQNYIFICEGELDAISLVQAGETNVVSITVGAKSFIPEWYDLLKRFELIYLVLDNDVVGQEGANVLAERLGKDRCLNILLPYGTKDNPIKDLNDYFKEHNINEFKGVALKATNFPLDTIYTVESVTEGIIRRLEGGKGLLEGYETPWPSLNQKMGVMARGDLIYLSAKPKSGKTSIALNICYNLSVNSKVPTLLFCLEMPPDRLVHKLIARHRMVDNVLLDDVYMTKLQFQENEVPLYFGYTTEKKYLNIDSITKLFELARKKYGIELFVFDNLQFLCRSIAHVYQEVAKTSRDFKLLAMNLNVPIIVIAQPRKLAETELMSSVDLKDSASLEADADTILIAHRKSLIKEQLSTVQLEHDSNLSPIVRVAVDRCRYAMGGFTSLYFSGSQSFLREATLIEISGT